MRTISRARTSLLFAVLGIAAGCDPAQGVAPGEGPTDAGKADGAAGVEIIGMIGPDAAKDGVLANKSARHGHIVHVTAGTRIGVEITRTGSGQQLDTIVQVHGPRTADGSWTETVAADDDAGWGKLSRLRDVEIEQDGFYLIEVAVAPRSASISKEKYRVALACDGECDASGPVVPAGLDVEWVERSAEYRAATIMAYAVATQRIERMHAAGELPTSWAVALDVDETLLSNVPYQRERAELGSGYTHASWTAWVARREARAIAGAAAFVQRVRELGGVIAIITNRTAAECDDTEANLQAEGLVYDVILCKTGSSAKGPRFDLVEDGNASSEHPAATIVQYVGDNIQDFPALTQAIAAENEAAYADFADAFVVLPNPMYGSWQGA